jgi:ribosomal protein S18 acetylase RimI-like enzyme
VSTDLRITIAPLSAAELADHVPALGALLHACVHAGASIGFVLPHPVGESEAFWRQKVLPPVQDGLRVLWVARTGGRTVGSVQLGIDTMPNQAHRADVSKLLVHPEFRRRGIARALMAALEQRAHELGRRLLTLDTRTGDHAEPLYGSLGYMTSGVIPTYCRHPREDRLESTTIMYKVLEPADASQAFPGLASAG